MKTRIIVISFLTWLITIHGFSQSQILNNSRNKTAFNVLISGSMNKKSITLNIPQSRSANTASSMFKPVICIDPFNMASNLEYFYSNFYPFNKGINPTSVNEFNLLNNSLKAFLFTSKSSLSLIEAFKFIHFNMKNNTIPSTPVFMKSWEFNLKQFSLLFDNNPVYLDKMLYSNKWTFVIPNITAKCFLKKNSVNASILLKNNLLNRELLILRNSDNSNTFIKTFNNPGQLSGIIAYIKNSNFNYLKSLSSNTLTPSLFIKKLAFISKINTSSKKIDFKNRNDLISIIPEIGQKLKNLPLLLIIENPKEEHLIKNELSLYKKRGLNITVATPLNIYKF